MLKPNREDALLKEIRLRGNVVVSEFAERLGISAVTVRRDLAALEQCGLVRRVYGGATAPASGAEAHRRAGRARGGLTIGMMVPTTGNYYADVIRAAKEAAYAHGARLVLGITNYGEGDERRIVAGMIAGGADGLLVTPSKADFTGPTLDLLLQSPVPVVLVERAVDQFVGAPRLESVRSDHEFGAELCVHHLYDQGLRRIALLSADNPTSPRLRAGYRKATADLGLAELYPEHALSAATWVSDGDPGEIKALLDELAEREVAGIIVQPDSRAMLLAREAATHGIAIPADLAMVAYDDQFSELSEVPLTGVSPPAHELGSTAVEMCLKRLRRPDGATAPPQQVRILPTLTVRASSVRPGHDDVN